MIKTQLITAVAGAASAISVVCGFRPKNVFVFNMSTAGSLEWSEGMPAASGAKVVTGGAQTFVTTGGITVNDLGFTLGTDATNAAPTVSTTATGSKESNQIVVASATGLAVGQVLVSAGFILPGTKIEAISGTTITLDSRLLKDMSATSVAVANLLIKVQ